MQMGAPNSIHIVIQHSTIAARFLLLSFFPIECVFSLLLCIMSRRQRWSLRVYPSTLQAHENRRAHQVWGTERGTKQQQQQASSISFYPCYFFRTICRGSLTRITPKKAREQTSKSERETNSSKSVEKLSPEKNALNVSYS